MPVGHEGGMVQIDELTGVNNSVHIPYLSVNTSEEIHYYRQIEIILPPDSYTKRIGRHFV